MRVQGDGRGGAPVYGSDAVFFYYIGCWGGHGGVGGWAGGGGE